MAGDGDGDQQSWSEGDATRSLAGRVRSEVIPETQLLILSVEHNDPGLAALIADNIADVFIEQIHTQQVQRFANLLSGMEQQISETLSLIEETQAEINALSDEEASTEPTPASPNLNPQSGQDTTQKGYLEVTWLCIAALMQRSTRITSRCVWM